MIKLYVRYWEPVFSTKKPNNYSESQHVVEKCESIRKMDRKIRIFYCMKEHCEIWYRDIRVKNFDYAIGDNEFHGTGHEKEVREPIIIRAVNNGPDRYIKGKELVKTHRA